MADDAGTDFVYLIDFGVAHDTAGARLTSTGFNVGTPAYMAPEGFEGTAAVDHRADIYALGCLLYEMLTARLPFEADNGLQLAYAHLQRTPPRPSDHGVPPEFDDIVARAMAKDPALRYTTAGKLAEAARAVRVEPVAPGPLRRSAPETEGAPYRGPTRVPGIPTSPVQNSTSASRGAVPDRTAPRMPPRDPSGPPPKSAGRRWVADAEARTKRTVPRRGQRPARPDVTRPRRRRPTVGPGTIAVIFAAVMGLILVTVVAYKDSRGPFASPGVIGRIATHYANDVALSPDGREAYVVGGPGMMSVIDTLSRSVLRTVPVSDNAASVAIAPDGRRAYVANPTRGSVSVLNTSTGGVVAEIPTGPSSDHVVVSDDGRRVQVVARDRILIIDTSTDSVLDTLRVPSSVSDAIVTPDGRRVYITGLVADDVTVNDTADGSIVSTVLASGHSLVVSPDGATVLVHDTSTSMTSVLDTRTNTRVGSIYGLEDATFSPDGRFAYGLGPTDNSVQVVDVATRTVQRTVDFGQKSTSRQLAVSPDGSRAYVYVSDALIVVNLSAA